MTLFLFGCGTAGREGIVGRLDERLGTNSGELWRLTSGISRHFFLKEVQ